MGLVADAEEEEVVDDEGESFTGTLLEEQAHPTPCEGAADLRMHTAPTRHPMLAGILAGGRSRRMGRSKALLVLASGETILARTVRVAREAGLEPVLVGPRPEIVAALGEGSPRCIDDVAEGRGPLGGLVALLSERPDDCVIALACDLPYLDARFLLRLGAAPPGPAVLAPRSLGLWEPLAARYDARRVLSIARRRFEDRVLGLQGLLDVVGAEAFALEDAERAALVDWDTPADARGAVAGGGPS